MLFYVLAWAFVTVVSSLELYLAPSKIPGAGQGIFTAEDIAKGSQLDSSVSITVDDYATQELNLINYVYQSPNEYYAAVLFGSALLVNHKPKKYSNVEREWLNDRNPPAVPSNALRPYSIYPCMTFVAKRDIKAGEEIYVTYGEEEYFRERFTTSGYGSAEKVFDPRTAQYDPKELRHVGVALSTINVSLSTIDSAGKGAFSDVDLLDGQRVTVSPALAVPKHLFAEWGRESVLLNYLISAPDTDVALLPLGQAAMMNHGGSKKSNVGIRWFDWKGRSVEAIFSDLSVDGITGFDAAPLYLEYYATRPISKGEELLLDYGADWESAWKRYLDVMSVWVSKQGSDGVSLLYAPQFRHPISSPEGMFPSSLKKECVGTSDCTYPSRKRRSSEMNGKLNKIGVNYQMDKESISLAKAFLKKSDGGRAVTVNGEPDTFEIVNPANVMCGVYLAPINHNKNTLSGVFSGVVISRETPVEGSVSVLIKKELLEKNQRLHEYSAESGRLNYNVMLFGYGSHMREGVEYNIDRNIMAKSKDDVPLPMIQSIRPFTTYENFVHFTRSDVQPGRELIAPPRKGSKPSIRTISNGNLPQRYALSELRDVGHCLTHIYVEQSRLPLGAKGVYTDIGHHSGAQVSVSQVLILPKHVLYEDDSSVLINYCISAPDTDVALLPLGQAAMMNHGGSKKSNVGIRWFDWKGRSVEDIFSDLSVDGITGFDAAPLYLEYYATRPISKGEELLLDYGADWESAWKRYLDVMSVWVSKQGSDGVPLLYAPQFRHPISSPEGMFPALFFKKKCFSSPLCSAKGIVRTSPYINAVLNRQNSTRWGSGDRASLAGMPAKNKRSDKLFSSQGGTTDGHGSIENNHRSGSGVIVSSASVPEGTDNTKRSTSLDDLWQSVVKNVLNFF